jgi:hypothetical protein
MCELSLVLLLPPCGRGLGPCKAIIETDPTGIVILHCLTCGCVAPCRDRGTADA